jgi:phosphoribosylformylglycinamidine synthase
MYGGRDRREARYHRRVTQARNTTPDADPMPTSTGVVRIEVRPREGMPDPRADAIVRQAAALGHTVAHAATARVYLIEAPLTDGQVRLIAERLLAAPIVESWTIGASAARPGDAIVEVHPLPGVMDPAAQSVRDAIRELLRLDTPPVVSTGWRYDLSGLSPESARLFAERQLANRAVQAIHLKPWMPDSLPRGRRYALRLTRVPLRHLDDAALERLSREAHLFLSTAEMRAIRDHYRALEREPTDVELETLAQTWSEHCVHKTLKSRVRYRERAVPMGSGEGQARRAGDAWPIRWEGRPGHRLHADGTVEIDNLLRSTVAAATYELIADGVDWTLSVFRDNSGVIAFDDRWGVCVKVETHNRPSAIEPYGGAATGVGGCIRDIIGTGLGARPIAGTDVFVVAPPDMPPERVPPGCLHPRRILAEVVAGVRDYGNRMGIPTVSGAVHFDERHVGNPLVFCGCIGLIPRDRVHGRARAGDLVVVLGGRTGRDGIHGATFSSAEITDTHADEFAHAVQIGNAIEEKRLLDAILRARDEHPEPLYSAITDCGAGGFSSAVGEMGAELGAEVDLDRAPLKYSGLSYTEIWISEAQERMVLAVPPDRLSALERICREEGVELAVLGRFGTPGRELVLRYEGVEVGRLSMSFLHEGLPMPTREAVWHAAEARPRSDASSGHATPHGVRGRSTGGARSSLASHLLALLAHPTIASKHWIIRQYDHEVQGGTVIKPLVGPGRAGGRGPGDAAVLEPIPGTGRGLAVACGLQTGVGDPEVGGDPYLMALAAIDECVRNLVCVGADPARIAILDNFCWPGCDSPGNMGALVRACAGCYDGAKAYRTPFISGKDSLNNQFKVIDPATGRVERLIEIPPTLLITGVGMVPDVSRCLTSDAKGPGNALLLVGRTTADLGGSFIERVADVPASAVPAVDLVGGPAIARAVASLIRRGLVRSAHDCSEGGLLVALAEMLIGGSTPGTPIGASVDLSCLHAEPLVAAFAESPARYLLEVEPRHAEAARRELERAGVPWAGIGRLDDSGRLRAGDVDVAVDDLARAWLSPLDW